MFIIFYKLFSLVAGADLRTFFCDPLQTSRYSGFRLGMMYIEKQKMVSENDSPRRPIYLLIIYHNAYIIKDDL